MSYYFNTPLKHITNEAPDNINNNDLIIKNRYIESINYFINKGKKVIYVIDHFWPPKEEINYKNRRFALSKHLIKYIEQQELNKYDNYDIYLKLSNDIKKYAPKLMIFNAYNLMLTNSKYYFRDATDDYPYFYDVEGHLTDRGTNILAKKIFRVAC